MTELAPHGTVRRYNQGCRECDECRTANAAYHRQLRAKRRATNPKPDHVHGTVNGYRNWDCRCEPCIDAWNVDQARMRRNRGVPEARYWTVEEEIELLEATDLKVVAQRQKRTLPAVRWRLWQLTGSGVPAAKVKIR